MSYFLENKMFINQIHQNNSLIFNELFFFKKSDVFLGILGFSSYISFIRLRDMIKTKQQNSMIEIDLTGPQGNSFFLIGTASNLAKQLGLDSKKIQTEMMTGDYENLIKTFDKYFGKFVILYR